MISIDDQYITNLFFNGKPYVNPNYLRNDWLSAHPEIKNYLKNRYSDSLSIKETVYRIPLNIEIRPVCTICGGEVTFDPTHRNCPGRNGWPYSRCCSLKCSANDLTTKERHIVTSIEKYGTEYPLQSEPVKNKIKQTNLDRYGVENVFAADEVKEKICQTNIDRYGVSNPNQNPDIIHQREMTCIKRYGTKTYAESDIAKTHIDEYKKKRIQTNLDRYGAEYPISLDEFKKKKETTCIEKYGTKTFCESDMAKLNQDLYNQKQRETNLEKFGVEYVFTADEIKKKIRDTNIRKYGTKTFPESDLAKLNMDTYLERARQTSIKKYGTPYYTTTEEYRNRQYETKKKHNSFHTSKAEDTLKEILLVNFPDTVCQHKTDQYPYMCDFYIPSLKLYIELQGTWTHGFHPYDPDTDAGRLQEMTTKSETSKFYKHAIKVWTIMDPEKRNTAKSNKLNYLEIYPKYSLKDVPVFIKENYQKDTADKQFVIGVS